VGGPALISVESAKFRFLDYFVNRFSRIFIVLIPALIISFALDAMGAALFPDALVDDIWPIGGHLNLLCNIVGLQGVACSSPLNPPLWSLGYEWTLYMSAPLLFLLALSPTHIVFRMAATGLLIGAAVVILPDRSQWPLILAWFAGAGVRRWSAKHDGSTLFAVMGTVIAIGGVFSWEWATTPKPVASLVTTIGLVLLFSHRRALVFAPAKNFFHIFASFSYSLYVIHYPVILFWAKALQHFRVIDAARAFNGTNVVAFILSVGLSVLAAYFFSRFTEAKTDVLRAAIRQPSRRRLPAAAVPQRLEGEPANSLGE
jgi:peptidoglycan/LPS O-acetylase OafA/YrhL